MQLTDETLAPAPEPPATMNHYITCIPSDSFGQANATEFWCKDFERGGSLAGDGTLNTYMMELSGPGWERSIQVGIRLSHLFIRSGMPRHHLHVLEKHTLDSGQGSHALYLELLSNLYVSAAVYVHVHPEIYAHIYE